MLEANCRNGWIEALRPPSISKLTEFIVQVINQEIDTKWFSNQLLVFFLRPVVFGSNSNPTAINVKELFEYRKRIASVPHNYKRLLEEKYSHLKF